MSLSPQVKSAGGTEEGREGSLTRGLETDPVILGPQKKNASGMDIRQTYKQTDSHVNSMTDPAEIVKNKTVMICKETVVRFSFLAPSIC